MKPHNTSHLFGLDGRKSVVYRKIHLFDVKAPDRAHYGILGKSDPRRNREIGNREKEYYSLLTKRAVSERLPTP